MSDVQTQVETPSDVPADPDATITLPAVSDTVAASSAAPQPVEEFASTAVPVATERVAAELLTCPECGTTAMVTLNRREATDFCRSCDYPLFWTPGAVVRDASSLLAEESLRRLPGTVGRASLAAIPCPHCAELNSVAAVLCVRCGGPMTIEAPPPPPPPVYVAPPAPPTQVIETPKQVAWWVWLLVSLGIAATIVFFVLLANGTFS